MRADFLFGIADINIWSLVQLDGVIFVQLLKLIMSLADGFEHFIRRLIRAPAQTFLDDIGQVAVCQDAA